MSCHGMVFNLLGKKHPFQTGSQIDPQIAVGGVVFCPEPRLIWAILARVSASPLLRNFQSSRNTPALKKLDGCGWCCVPGPSNAVRPPLTFDRCFSVHKSEFSTQNISELGSSFVLKHPTLEEFLFRPSDAFAFVDLTGHGPLIFCCEIHPFADNQGNIDAQPPCGNVWHERGCPSTFDGAKFDDVYEDFEDFETSKKDIATASVWSKILP